MRTLLVCTDGSAFAASLYDHAAWAALRLGAGVHVLHTLDPHHESAAVVDYTGSLGPDAQAELMKELVSAEQIRARAAQARGRALLTAAKTHLETAGVAPVETEQRHGSLLDGIAASEARADLILIGKRGETAHRDEAHLGGNVERVVRACRHPVLVAPRAFASIRSLLLAYDGSPGATQALDFVAASPLCAGLTCHLLRTGKLDDIARWYLGEAAERLRQAGFDVVVHAIPGDPETVLAETVAREKADLLVMGAYGHSRIREFLVGSTTTAMIRTSPVPVLLMR